VSEFAPVVPRLLRRLAAILVRGPDAPYVRGDLETAYERDVERGLTVTRARRRYVTNMLVSAVSLAVARLRRPRLGVSILDVKLGLRMLRKHPGLTAVAVFALSMGIPVGLIPIHVQMAISAPLPFEEGERLVRLRNLNLENGRSMPQALRDFDVWRGELTTFEGLGLTSSEERNIASEDGRAAPLQGSAMTASAFDLLRVRPLMGRPLLEDDERPGAQDVVVIGYDLWQSRLGADPDVIGRTIRVGSVPYEVVGVMPDGFMFPDRDHFWIPFPVDPLEIEWGQGPDISAFGRLADGASLAQANAELFTLGQRIATEHPETHRQVRAEVLPFADLELLWNPAFWMLQLIALLLLTVACGNVGTLVLARAATRSAEIAVRTALGASRARVVGQIFIETLLLALLGAGVGLVIGDVAATRLQEPFKSQGMPFWIDFGVTWKTALTALALASFSATMAGVIPALKATGGDVQRGLQRAAAGISGIRFGRLAAALIIAEVALSIQFLSIGGQMLPSMLQDPEQGMQIVPEAYLVADVAVRTEERVAYAGSVDTATIRARVTSVQEEILRRVAEAPGVRGVTLASRVPGEDHPRAPIEVEGGEVPRTWVRYARVDVDFFGSLDQPVLNGRDFDRTDIAAAPEGVGGVIVNTSFAADLLEGRNPVGQRIRLAARNLEEEAGPWLDIVGVVGHLGMNEINPEEDAGMYIPVTPGLLNPGRLAVHVEQDPASFIPELRRLVADVDPDAMISEPMPLTNAVRQSEARLSAFWIGGVLVPMIAVVAILLSAACLYALVSFTVSERRREIGIRTALGARSGDIVSTVARRAFLQLGCGVLAGLVMQILVGGWIGGWIGLTAGSSMRAVDESTLLSACAGVTLIVGLVGCVPPLRRGLRTQPVEVLKEV
jgi:predicted permease